MRSLRTLVPLRSQSELDAYACCASAYACYEKSTPYDRSVNIALYFGVSEEQFFRRPTRCKKFSYNIVQEKILSSPLSFADQLHGHDCPCTT